MLLAQPSDAGVMKWKRLHVDASRTGVKAPNADNVPEAMGSFDGSTYVAPNGNRFKKKSATAKVAKLMIDAQPSMAFVKELVGYAPKAMTKRSPESDLSDWFIDLLMVQMERQTGRKADIGITNFGGIRADLPAGDVLYDDIQSMFPFNNTLCYVVLKGTDVKAFFEKVAARSMPVVGGVKVVVKDRKLESLLVGGEPVEDDKLYGVATISFLLDGGDGMAVAQNAVEVIDTGVPIFDAVIAYVRELTAAGKNIEYQTDGRVEVIGGRGPGGPGGPGGPFPGGPMPGGPMPGGPGGPIPGEGAGPVFNN